MRGEKRERKREGKIQQPSGSRAEEKAACVVRVGWVRARRRNGWFPPSSRHTRARREKWDGKLSWGSGVGEVVVVPCPLRVGLAAFVGRREEEGFSRRRVW
jgi:hypothetical protein